MKRKYTKKEIILSLAFSLFETLIILLLGYLIHNVNIIDMIIVCVFFFIPRMIFKGASHYQSPLKCFVISTLLGVSMISVFPISKELCYILSFFTGLILTEKGDITNLYQWSGRTTKYEPLREFITRNPNNKTIIENEEYWRSNYYDRYTIFIMFFRENKCYREINSCLGLEPDNNNKIKEECKIIYSTFEKVLRLPPLQ